MIKNKSSLYVTLTLIVVVTTFTVMSLYAVYIGMSTKSQIIQQMHKDSKLSVTALKENVATLISSYAVHDYEQLVQAEIERHSNTLAIVVEDLNMGEVLGKASFFSGKIRDSNWNIVGYDIDSPEQKELLKESYFSVEHNIVNALEKKVGVITIYTSSRFLNREIIKRVKESITQAVVITLLLIIVLTITLKYFILQPLSNIVAVISNSDSDGIPTEKLPIHDSKEIGALTSSMNRMIDSIHYSRLEMKRQNKQLELFSKVFNNTQEGISVAGPDQLIIDVNPAFCAITGFSREDVIGQSHRILKSGKQGLDFYQNMLQQINTNGYWQGEVWNRKKSGELNAVLLSIATIKNEFDDVVNYVCVFSDITNSKRQQEKLSFMAHYDELTGLPNRALFSDRFTQAIAHSKRVKHKLAVCFLDLDNFKPINDNYGHEAGDQLLIEVAERITANIREEDTVSRQGGDEFALLLNDIESFTQCEQTLQRIHDALAKPYILNGSPCDITASSGVTLYPDDDGDIDTLLRHADQAMYQAKLAGKHRYSLFNPEDDQLTIQKHDKLEEISQAIANKDFQLYYQPKVNMRTGEVFGAEALIRWVHPEKGVILPLDFLPSIDGTELEVKVGNWVITEALSQLEAWQQQDISLEVSVNISSHHLLSKDFLTKLDLALAEHPLVDPQCLQLEILETSALGDLNTIKTIIDTCQSELGIKVALDDFGTGYSSLTHLRNLPAKTLKIDQSFVRDMLDDPSDYAIIDGIIGLSNSFQRSVIAEGVETTCHGLMLLLMGCDEAQGYGIAKPMPARDFPQWLTNYSPNQKWLDSGNKHYSTKETKVELFKLVTEHWKDMFVNCIQSTPQLVEYWPIMDSKHCSCGGWVKQMQQEQFFKASCLTRVDKAHEALHNIAYTLLLQFQRGEVDAAREGLTVFYTACDKLSEAFEMCE